MTTLRRINTWAAIGVALVFVLLVAYRGGAAGPPSATLTFAPIADTYVDSGSAKGNFNSDSLLRVDGRPTRISYLRFAVTGVNGRPVQSARLRLETGSPTVLGGTIHLITDNTWDESSITFNTRPAVDGPGLDTLGPVSIGTIAEFNLDGAIPGDGVYNVAIDSTNHDGGGYLSMASTTGQKPQLVLVVDNGPNPIVTIVQPPDVSTFFAGDPVPLQVTVADDVDVNLAAFVQWSSDRDGSLGTGASITPTLSQGSHVVTASVTDSDSLPGTDHIGLTIIPPPPDNTEPLVSITAPLSGKTFLTTDSVHFSGTATDLEDGVLTASLTWTSDVDGPIGTGGDFTTTLGAGTHDVVASTTDSGGLQGTAAITFNVVLPDNREFTPDADTYVDSVRPTVNYGTAPLLRVDASSERITYMRFTVSGIGSKTVSEAVLRMNVDSKSGAGSDRGGTLHTISSTTWDENAITYDTRPAVDGPAIATAGAVAPSDVVIFDVSSVVTTDGSYSFALVGDSADGVKYHSKEAGTPTLILNVSGNAPVVSLSAPADGTVVFSTDPPLTFNATATDLEDGDLSSAITWTSDLDGALGTGPSVSASLSVGAHVVTATATDIDGFTGSASITVIVRAANTAPQVSITTPLDGGTVTVGVPTNLVATVADDFDTGLESQVEWASSADGVLGTGSPLSVTLSEGVHTLTASVVDSDGATGADQVTCSALVAPPNAAPIVTILAPADGAALLGATSVGLSATAADAEDGDLGAQIRWTSSLDGMLGNGAALTVPILSAGTHVLTASVTDSDGAATSASVTVTIAEGTLTVPVEADTYVDVRTPGTALGSEAAVRADASPVREAYLRFNVTGIAPFAVDNAILRLTVGPKSGHASSKGGKLHSMSDNSWSEASTTFNNRPVVDGPLLGTQGKVSRKQVVDFDVTGAIAGDGVYSFAIVTNSTDAVGYNSRESGVREPVLIITLMQNTPPALAIIAPPSGTIVLPGNAVTLGATATDNEDGDLGSQVVWSSDIDGTIGTGSSLTVMLSPGLHAITATVTDSSGLSDQASITVNAGSAPTVTIGSPADGTVMFVADMPISLAGTASDVEDGNLSGQLQWSSDLDGALGSGASLTASLSAGQHAITAEAVDSDGLVGQAQVTVRVRNPNVEPQVTVTTPADGTAVPAGTAITFTATATDDFDGDLSGQLAWTSDVAGPLGTGGMLTVVLAEGTHVVTASVSDSDGVQGSGQVTVTVLPTPPMVAIASPAAPTTIFEGDTLTFAATAVDVTDGDLSAGIGWTSNLDGPLFTGASFTTTGLSVGTHSITAAVADGGGLTGEATVAVVVRPPNLPPAITIDSPSDGAFALAGQVIILSATATDAEDGDLSDQVGWTSDIDGELGTGASLTLSGLSAGAHLLTAAIADLDGALASASVTLTIGAQTLTVPVEADTYVDAGVPNDILGADTVFRLDSSPERISYLRFNVVGVAPFAVQQAILRLKVGPKTGHASNNGGTVHAISDGSWTEATTNYNNRPVVDGPPLATQGKVRTKKVVDFDVTAALRGDGSYNFALVSDSSDAAGYDSREASSGQPLLILTLKTNTPPVIGITAPAVDTTVLPGVPLTLIGTATDVEDGDLAGAIQWTSSLQGSLGTGSSLTVTLDPGQHTITAAVTDSSGANTTADVTVNIGSPPAVTVTAPADGSTAFTTGGTPPVASVSFAGGATDSIDGDLGASIVWTSSIDGAIGTGSAVTASLGVGLHTITASVTDSEGITSQAQITLRVRTPNVAPVVTITTPGAGATSPAGTPLALMGTASDDFDGDISNQIEWISDVDGALGTGTTLSVMLTEGAQTLTASVTDSDGATSDTQVAVTITPTPPVVTITAPVVPGPISPLGPTTVFSGNPVTFAATVSDATDSNLGEAVEWTSDLDGSLFTGATFTTTTLSVGTHTITASVTDSGGLPGQAQTTIVVRPPDAAPVVTVDSPADGASLLLPVSLSATATDLEDGDLSAQIQWSSDVDGVLGTGATLTLPALSLGAHVLTGTVTDLDGLSSSASVAITVGEASLVVPVEADTYVDAGVPSDILGAEIVLKVDASPERVGYLRFNVAGVAPFAIQQAILRLTVGPKSGNASASGGTMHAISDGSWTEATTNYTNRPVVDGPALATQGSVRTGDVIDFDVTSALIADGIYNFALVTDSSDGAGYNSRESGSDPPVLVLTLAQNTPPVVAITAPASGTVLLPADSLVLNGTAADAEEGDLSSRVEWRSNRDGVLGMGPVLTVPTLSPGAHTITAAVTDSSGATSESSIEVIFEDAPEINIVSPGDGSHQFVTEPITFAALASDLQDGDMSAQVDWSSSIDGPLGTGSTSACADGPLASAACTSDGECGVCNDGTNAGGACATDDDCPPNAGDPGFPATCEAHLCAVTPGTSTLTVATLSLGTHAITATTTDSRGLIGQATIVVTVEVNDPPSISITAPPALTNYVEGMNATFSATATDPEQGDISADVNWTSDRDGPLGAGGSLTTTALSVGTHLITATIADNRGLQDSDDVTVTVEVNDPPSVSIITPAPGSTFQMEEQVVFAATASDPEDGDIGANIVWTSDRDGQIGVGAGVNTTTLSIGTHVVTAEVADTLGLTDSTQVTITIINDAPQLSIDAPADGGTSFTLNPVTFSATAIDTEDGDIGARVQWTSSRDGAIGTGGSFVRATLSIGTHIITASVTDNGAATTTAEIVFTVNDLPPGKTAPVVTITQPADFSAFEFGDLVTCAGLAVDDDDGDLSSIIQWSSSVDGAIGAGASITVDTLTIATHNITATVTDGDGVVRSDTVTIQVEVPNALPVVTLNGPLDGIEVNQQDPIDFSATAADVEDGDLTGVIEWSSDVDGVLATGGDMTLTTLSPGTHVITATVADSRGGVGMAQVTVTVHAIPVVDIIIPVQDGGYLTTTSVNFFATATDAADGDVSASLQWTSDLDGSIGTGQTFTLDTLSVGTHTVTAVATNINGGVGTAQVSFVVAEPLLTFSPTADAYVDEGFANKNFGLDSLLIADAGPTVRESYLRFMVTGIGSFPVAQAQLHLTAATNGATNFAGDVHNVTDQTWVEDAVTFNNRPAVDPAVIVSVNKPVGGNEEVPFDLTPALAGDGTYDFAILSTSLDAAKYRSNDAASGQPYLTVLLGQPSTPGVPDVAILSPTSGDVAFDDAPVTLTAVASDAEDGDLTSSITWQSDLDGPLGAGGTMTPVLSRGAHTVSASVQDSLGLSATATATLTIVDRPPTVTITAPDDGHFFPSGFPVTFSATATDDLDGDLSASLEWSSNRDGSIGTGSTVTTATLSPGDHLITAGVMNADGTPGGATITVFIDQAPPVVTIEQPTDGTTFAEGEAFTLMGAATDVEDGDLSAGLQWSSDLEGSLGTGPSVPVTLATVGTHTITTTVTDSHGFTRTDEITVTVDAAPPAVTILAPLDGDVVGPVIFDAVATDVPDGDVSGSIQWTSDADGSLGTGSSITATLSPGAHVVTASVTDSEGLTGSATVALVSGLTLPVVHIVDPVSSAGPVKEATVNLGDPVTLTATAVDPIEGDLSAGIEWSSNLGGVIGTGASIATSALIRGRHIITASVMDAEGLTAAAEIAVTVAVPPGNDPPVVTVTSPSGGADVLVGTPLTFAATAIDDMSGDLSANLTWVSSLEGLIGVGDSFSTALRTVGTHTVTVSVADATGLVGSATVTLNVVAAFQSFLAEADAYTDQTAPAANFGTDTAFKVDSSPLRNAYLRFTVAGVTEPIDHAVLRLQTTSSSSAGSDAGGSLAPVTDNTWGETTLTFDNAPVADQPAVDSIGPIGPSQTVELNVTSVIAGNGTYSFILAPVSKNQATYRSREAGVGRPELRVFFAPPTTQEPTVHILGPADQSTLPPGVPALFTATASDAQDGDLSVAVIWRSDVDGILGIGPSMSRTISPGPHVIMATVNDTDGNSSVDLIHVMVGASPVVTIDTPGTGTAVPIGEPILFAGSAVDPQDGDLSFFLEWSSSVDGPLATGPSFSGALSPGTHTVTAVVTDGDGNTGAASVNVTVTVPTDVGFEDFAYGPGVDQNLNRLTGSKPEAKLWYTPDGIWWGTLWNPSAGAYTMHRFDFATQAWVDSGVFIDERPTSRQDVMLDKDGKTLYVLSRFSLPPGQNRLLRYTYHPGAQTFVLDAGFPINMVGGGTESMTITKDSTGMMWAAYTLADTVFVTHTIGSDTEWADPFIVPIGDEQATAPFPSFDDIAGVVALDGAIGVFWSNQLTKEDYLAVHPDGTPPTDPASWSLEVAVTGGSAADDHFNMKAASDGRLFVVVKTSYTAIGSTLVGVLVRTPDGTWSPMHHVVNAEWHATRPIILLDEVSRKIRVFFAPFTGDGQVFGKVSDMDAISFPDPDGIGTPIITNATATVINNMTSSHQNITPSTGFVALGSGSGRYWHTAMDPQPAPSVTIDTPADGVQVAAGNNITFSGSAFSLADGVISSQIEWTSNLDGPFGIGASVSTTGLTDGIHTITASVTDSDLVTGSATITITVEADVAPVVTITQPVTGQKFLDTDALSLAATALDSLDGDLTASLVWTSDIDGTLGNGGSVNVPGLSVGTHTITAAVADSSSLVGTASVSIEVQVLAGPSLTITAPADGLQAGFGAPVAFAGSAADTFDGDITASLSWVSDRDGAIGTGGSFSRSSLSLGTHTITANIADSHGLTDSASLTLVINDPPTLSIAAPASGTTYLQGETVGLSATASDPQDGDITASIAWSSSVDGVLGAGGSLSVNTLNPGIHVLTAAVTDSMGSSASVQETITVLSVPSVAITSPADGLLVEPGDPVTLTATATDAEDGDLTASIAWSSSIDGPLGTGGTINTTGLLTSGTHTITASVTNSGSIEATEQVTVIVNAIPTVTLIEPADGSAFASGDTVSLTATAVDTEDGDLTASIDWTSSIDGPIGSGGSATTDLLSSGTHLLTAQVADSGGRTATTSVTITVNALPTVTISSPSNGTQVEPSDLVIFTATAADTEDGDLTASIDWTSSIDGALGSGGTITTTLSSGTHIVTATVTDAGGATTTATVAVIVNATPTITITGPASGSVFSPGDVVNLVATASDAEDGNLTASIQWISSIDNIIGSGGSVSIAALSSGTHLIGALVIDSGGRSATATITVVVNAKPTVSITAPASGSSFASGASIDLAAIANDLEDGDLSSAISWSSSNDGALGSGGNLSVVLSDGIHVVGAFVVDSVGKVAVDNITVVVGGTP